LPTVNVNSKQLREIHEKAKSKVRETILSSNNGTKSCKDLKTISGIETISRGVGIFTDSSYMNLIS